MKASTNQRIVKIRNVLLILGLTAAVSCRTHRELTKTTAIITEQDSLGILAVANAGRIQNLWIKKFTGNIILNGIEENFKGHLRLVKDSLMIIGLQSNLGIEGVRIYFTRDSILFVNRIGKKFYHNSTEEVRLELNLSVELSLLQSLVLADVVALTGSDFMNHKLNGRTESDQTICLNTGSDREVIFAQGAVFWLREACFWKDSHMPAIMEYQNGKKNNSMSIRYEKYLEDPEAGIFLPGFIDFRWKKNKETLFYLELEIERFVLNSKFPASIKIGSGMEQVKRIMDL